MSGFTGIYIGQKNINRNLEVLNFMKNIGSLFIKNNFISKFKEDKLFVEDNEIFICLDGVIYNSNILKKSYNVASIYDLIKKMYNKNHNFVNELRGNFNGCVYDKLEQKMYIFTNHMGTKDIFYFVDKENGQVLFSSNIKELLKLKKALGYSIKLSEEGAYFLLTYGYMLEDYTLIKNIKRLKPGTILEIKDNELKEKRYFLIDNENYIVDTKEKIIDEMNERFQFVVNQVFSKDLEYGYKHIITLSGGMDSRVISFYAKKLGYNNLTNITFSQSECSELKVATNIAKYLGNRFLINILDNGNYLLNLKETICANNGQNIYIGAAHSLSTIKVINFDRFGLYHNGNVADAVHGDYLNAPFHTKPKVETWAHSTRLLNKINDISNDIIKNYNNQELFAIYNRGINGMLNGSKILYDYTETCEMFLHQDLIEYSMRIPPKYKYKEALFIEMINKYIPEAVKFPWVGHGNYKPNMFNYKISSVYKIIDRIRRKSIKVLLNNIDSMNPLEVWFNRNNTLKEFVDNYFNNNIYLLDNYKNIKSDSCLLYNNGNFIEKSQVITLLEAYKQLITDI